jgi:hypothetical protein
VPTRQGVQKPQDSWAKKWAKLRATSNMSRDSSKTMKAPAVGEVLEGDAATEFLGGDADAGRAGDLHRLGVGGAAVLQDLAHGDTVGIFINARPLAVAAD